MRFRSEWLTLLALTAAVAGGLALPRGGMPEPVPGKRLDPTAAGIDDRPVGSIGGGRRHGSRAKPTARHP